MNTYPGQHNMLNAKFAPNADIRAIIFDVDDTLTVRTPEHARIWADAFWATTNEFNPDHGMTREEHDRNRLAAYRRDGTSSQYLAGLCGIEELVYFERMYTIAERIIVVREEDMVTAFAAAHHKGVPMIALTSGLRIHTERVLGELGVADYLPIIDLRDTNKLLKSKGPEAWLMAAKKLGIDPKNILIVEDNLANAEQAFLAGMYTAIVTHGKEPTDKPDYIHYWLPKAHHAFGLLGK